MSAFQLPLQPFPRHDSISMAFLRPGTPSSPLVPHMCACLLPPARPGTLRPHHTALIGSPSHILVPAMLRSLVGALFRSHVPDLRRPSSFLMVAPSRSAVPALPRLSVPPSCCTHPGRLEPPMAHRPDGPSAHPKTPHFDRHSERVLSLSTVSPVAPVRCLSAGCWAFLSVKYV